LLKSKIRLKFKEKLGGKYVCGDDIIETYEIIKKVLK
jgi:hypothetical protein